MTKNKEEILNTIVNLQENCSHFFNKTFEKYSSEMECKKGCSKCCFVSLSIFPSEALQIITWAKSLNEDEKKSLLENLNKIKSNESKNAAGKLEKSCSFLLENECSIYPARPVICRTQGLPLQIKVNDPLSRDKNQIQYSFDSCPLNFSEEEKIPPRAEWLDLERLNALQSIAENFVRKNIDYSISENEINEILDSTKERVRLSKLKKKLISILENS